MQRRETLKTVGGIGVASLHGIGASGTVAASEQRLASQKNNPGRLATYNGHETKTAPGSGDSIRCYYTLRIRARTGKVS